MRSRPYLVLCSLLLLVICGATNAQSIVTGAVSGTITDPSGAVVTDAKVTLVSDATQETQTAVTGPTGTYQFPLLKPGKYSVMEKPCAAPAPENAITTLQENDCEIKG